uniref:Beta-galactosidase n=1 Tax=Timema bartmani TaxID=61472 RepID=A0A7R9F5V6_9NEOP|nr:unnamed protein product [Timema bartmani]
MFDNLPTLYEYYTKGGIDSGLTTYHDGFLLNGKNITIISGAIHYFRVHPGYWRDRLRKLRAAGFNAVETYIAWNLHEPEMGVFDFGDGDNDFSPFLNFRDYIRTAQEEDLLVVIRPGPWISAEWDNGAIPGWIYREANMRIRRSYAPFIKRMTAFFDQVFPLLRDLQFTEGGPIIAFQIENEYGLVGKGASHPDTAYLAEIHQQMLNHNLTALHYTMDAPISSYRNGSLDGVLMTANFQSDPVGQLTELKRLQPDQPLWVMELYPGWFDNWFEKHQTKTTEAFINMTRTILDMNSSINIYMFHGGTTFGFMNGAIPNTHTPTWKFHTSSYALIFLKTDFDAPLSEAGDYTEKYNATADLVKKYLAVQTRLPELPAQSVKEAYPAILVTEQLEFNRLMDLVSTSDRVTATDVTAMELLDVNGGSGQCYGFVVYRKTGLQVPPTTTLEITGTAHDMAVVMVDGVRKTEPITSVQQVTGFGYWQLSNATLSLDDASVGSNRTLDILVENWGRRYNLKGLYNGPVLLNGEVLQDWEILALQFKKKWIQSLSDWQEVSESSGPTLYGASLEVEGTPRDTFINMSTWGKGNVLVNGFNIGRYFSVGPTHTMYVPAPLLNQGANEILVFELFSPSSEIIFTDTPILDNP